MADESEANAGPSDDEGRERAPSDGGDAHDSSTPDRAPSGDAGDAGDAEATREEANETSDGTNEDRSDGTATEATATPAADRSTRDAADTADAEAPEDARGNEDGGDAPNAPNAEDAPDAECTRGHEAALSEAASDDPTPDVESDSSSDSDSDATSAEETVRALEEAHGLDPVEEGAFREESERESGRGERGDDEGEARPTAPTATDGAAPAPAAATGTDAGTVDAPMPDAESDSTSGFGGEGPQTDEEMPLADHIEEMVRRLGVVFAIAGTITLLLYPGADIIAYLSQVDFVSASDVITYLWNVHIPGAPEMADRRPRLYGPLELILTELKVASLVGVVVGLPVFVYQTYRFMRPGLYPTERRYYLAAVPTSLVLAVVGVGFAHFVILPAIFAYFTSYTQGTAIVAFGLRETFNLILILMGYMAVVFQIPLFIMLGIMMGLFTRVWLTEKRLLFWGAFLGLAFLVSPDPTGMAPIIVAATMISLFEGTLALLKWTGH